jgi:hypothetical protein
MARRSVSQFSANFEKSWLKQPCNRSYRTEVERLAAAERKFAQATPPMEALRAWMLLFVDYIATKKIIAPVLNTLVGDSSPIVGIVNQAQRLARKG